MCPYSTFFPLGVVKDFDALYRKECTCLCLVAGDPDFMGLGFRV